MNFKTLIPAVVALVVFAATLMGKPVDQLNVEQIVTAVVTLVGVLYGILTNHQTTTIQHVIEPAAPPIVESPRSETQAPVQP